MKDAPSPKTKPGIYIHAPSPNFPASHQQRPRQSTGGMISVSPNCDRRESCLNISVHFFICLFSIDPSVKSVLHIPLYSLFKTVSRRRFRCVNESLFYKKHRIEISFETYQHDAFSFLGLHIVSALTENSLIHEKIGPTPSARDACCACASARSVPLVV